MIACMKQYRRKILCVLAALLAAAAVIGSFLAFRWYRPFRPVNPKSVAHLKVSEQPLGLRQDVDYAYSMALVGDTQAMNWKYPEHYLQMYDWVVANRDTFNIRYLIGLGDITDRYVEYKSKGCYHQDASGRKRSFADEWVSTSIALRKLNGVVPYAINNGNHDDGWLYHEESDDYNYRALADDYFNIALNSDPSRLNPYGFRYMEYTTPGGIAGTDYGYKDPEQAENTWRKITIGTQHYLILTLRYGAQFDEDTMNWADGIIRESPDCQVILSTHDYLDSDKEHTNDLWERLVYPNENVCLAVCGHRQGDDIVYQFSQNAAGKDVLEMMINPHGLGDVGLIAILYFDSDGKPVGVEYYSTVEGTFFRDVNQILF